MNHTKILHLNDAFIKPYPPMTMLLSILQHNPRAFAWVCENYFIINVYTGNEYKAIETDHNLQKLNIREWTACPFLRKYLYPYHWVNRFWGSLSNCIIEALEDEQYIYLRINTKFIGAYQSDVDWNHQILIYGYDSTMSIFYCTDFIANKYTHFKASYQELNHAFLNTILVEDDIGGICGLQIQDTQYEIIPKCQDNYLFTSNSLRLNLVKYMNPEINQTEYTLHNKNYYSGIDAYHGIALLLEMNEIDLTSAYSVYANKVIIQKAFELAGLTNSQYCTDLHSILFTAKKFLNMHVKSILTSESYRDKKILVLDELAQKERIFYSHVIMDL